MEDVMNARDAAPPHWTRYVMGAGLLGILFGVVGQLLNDNPVVPGTTFEAIGYVGLFLFFVAFLIFVTVE